jgi:hypothetical protein
VLAVLTTLVEPPAGVDAGWFDTRACNNDWVKLCRSWAIWPRLLTAGDEVPGDVPPGGVSGFACSARCALSAEI